MLPGVSKTAILTLRARADEHLREDRVFADPLAHAWFQQLEWPAELDEWYADGAQTNLALRVDDIDHILRRFAEDHPVRSVVELGCGLSSRPDRLAGLGATWTGVDLPEVIEQRERWSAPGRNVAASVLDDRWMQALEGAEHVFVAEGLFYYLPRAEVDALLTRLAERFAGSVLITDVIGVDDFPKLLENTARLEAPIQWHHEGPFTEALERFGLEPVDGFEPDYLLKSALVRYFKRLGPALRVMSWWALNADMLPPGRSGNILGRLTPS